MIDCILRRGEYAKFYNDIETAKQDYLEAIEICKEFIVGNERTLGSAYFQLGSLFLDCQQREQAQVYLKEAERVQKDYLVRTIKQKGQNFELNANDITSEKLVEPSIYDDDDIKNLKLILKDICEFIKECVDMATMQPELEKLKAEAAKKKAELGQDVDVPASFSEVPADAATYATVKVKLKPKKRNLEEAQKSEDKPEQPSGPNDENKNIVNS